MTDSDVLQRAAAALRAADDGQREGSGFTRARILTTLSERRRPRPWRWLVTAPLASLLLVGSAWAQSTGNWTRVWQAVATVLPFVQTPSALPAQPHVAPAAQPQAPPTPDPLASPEVEPAPAPEQPLLQVPPPAAPPPSARPRPLAPAGPPPARGSAQPAPPSDPELGTFRGAHELHVRGETRAAVAAYADYLRAYPRGRFVPEARYNTALDWIKLGDTAAARSALAPFADGAYGGYRQHEARELLQALSERQ